MCTIIIVQVQGLCVYVMGIDSNGYRHVHIHVYTV